MSKTPVDTKLIDFWLELTSPCLSLISGYLFFYKTKARFDFLKKLKSRLHSLVIPYIIWTVAFFLIFFAMKETYLKVFHTSYWYAPILSINVPNLISVFANPPLINFWYLQNLILIIPFNYLIYYLLKNRFVFFGFFAFIICIYSFNLFNIYFQPRFLPYYLLGCFLGYHEIYVPKIHFNRVATLLIIPVLFFAATATSHIDYSGIIPIISKILIALVFIIGIYNLIDSNINSTVVVYLKNNKAYSFFLFAIHMFLFTLVQRCLMKLGLEQLLYNKYYALMFNILSYSIVLFLAILIARLLKSKSPKFYFFITGRQ
jgi:hypothetical protein